jgi:hypothetical protein
MPMQFAISLNSSAYARSRAMSRSRWAFCQGLRAANTAAHGPKEMLAKVVGRSTLPWGLRSPFQLLFTFVILSHDRRWWARRRNLWKPSPSSPPRTVAILPQVVFMSFRGPQALKDRKENLN